MKKGRRVGQIIEKAPRKYLVSVFLGRDANGRKQYTSKTVEGTKGDADKALRELLTKRDAGRLVRPSAMTVEEYLTKRWLPQAVALRARKVTSASYELVLNRYVIPHVGTVRLGKLHTLHIQAMVSTLVDQGLAPRTVRYAASLLNSALRQALRWRLISSNPYEGVELPREQRRELVVPDAALRDRLVEQLEADRWWPLWCLLLTTGLRPGEALGLKWNDLDLEHGTVTVRRALARLKGGQWELAEPKTERGRRTVTFPTSTSDALRRRRTEQIEERFKVAPYWHDLDLVFTGPLGEPLDWANLRHRHFEAAARRAAMVCTVCGGRLVTEKAGEPRHEADHQGGHVPTPARALLELRPYDLRHLHATLLLASGKTSLREISTRLGHFDPGFTLATYTHSVPGGQDVAAAAIDEALFGRARKG